MLESANHQEGAREQHQRHGDLRHHQRVGSPEPPAAAPGLLGVGRRLEAVHQIQARALQSGGQAAEDRGEDGQRHARRENASIHAEGHADGQLGRDLERAHGFDARVPDENPGQSSRERENQALRQEQPDQPKASGADREPHGDLARPRPRAGEQESSGVRAGDEKDGQGQDREDHAELPFDAVRLRAHLEHRVHGRAAVAIRLRILALEVPREHGDFVLRLPQGDSRLQAALDRQLAVVAVDEEILSGIGRECAGHREGDVEVGPVEDVEAGERLRRDPDDGEVFSVQANGPADGGRIAAELAPPEVRRKDRDGVAAGHRVLLFAKAAADGRLDAEHGEVIARHEEPALDDRGGVAVGAEAERGQRRVGDHAVVAGHAIADVPVLEIRERVVGVVVRGAHEGHHAARVGHGVGPEDQRVEHAEGRDGHPDSQGDRDHHEGGQSRRPPQAADRVTDVVHEIRQPVHAARVADLFLLLFEPAHRPQRTLPGLLRRKPFRDAFLGLLVQVELELFVELPLDLPPSKDGSEPEGRGEDPAGRSHRPQASESCTTCEIAEESRCQFAASDSSCPRPRCVSA